jgi:hypothetical protein
MKLLATVIKVIRLTVAAATGISNLDALHLPIPSSMSKQTLTSWGCLYISWKLVSSSALPSLQAELGVN